MKSVVCAATAVLVLAGPSVMPATATADPQTQPTTPTETADIGADSAPAGGDQPMHNITYRARIDGVARGALITYKINDTQVQSADPTMLPGRVFEAQSVLSDPDLAGMQVSIQWPYGANLHCEILVDDITTAKADQFIRPRLTHADEDPDYGKLFCGAPLINPAGAATAEPSAPDAPASPSDAPVPPLT